MKKKIVKQTKFKTLRFFLLLSQESISMTFKKDSNSVTYWISQKDVVKETQLKCLLNTVPGRGRSAKDCH